MIIGEQKRDSEPYQTAPLFVDVSTLCVMLSCGRTKANELINTKAVASCLIGKSRRIDLASIYAFRARLLGTTDLAHPDRSATNIEPVGE